MIIGNSISFNSSSQIGAELKQARTRTSAADESSVANLDWSGVSKSHLEFSERRDINHRVVPINQAGAALKSVSEELTKLQKAIADIRPSLANEDWDFTMKDGELKVTGAISDGDKRWLEGVLNSSSELKAAAKSYVNAAVAYLETSDENPVYQGRNAFTGKVDLYDFKDVETQAGKVFSFKNVIRELSEGNRDPATGKADPLEGLGGASFALLASRLKPQSILV